MADENKIQPQIQQDEKLIAAIGYFGPFFVIPLVIKPKSVYCKFHAKQSMAMFLLSILVLVVLASIPMLGSLLTLGLFAVYILAIYRAYKGDLWAIPGVSIFAGKIDVEMLYGKAGLAISNISGFREAASGLVEKTQKTVENLGSQTEEKK